VAWDSDRNEYFVVWYDGPRVTVYGQRFYADGSTNQDAVMISTNYMKINPDVAYDSDRHQYLVVWYDRRNSDASGDDIYARRVAVIDGLAYPAGQGDFLLAGAPYDQRYPAVAYSAATSQFLVTWDDWRNGETTLIYGQRVWWPGLLLGHSFAVNAARGTQEQPAVAYNDLNHETLAVWADERNGAFDLYGQLYDSAGLPLGENLALVESPGAQLHPSVAYNLASDEYLLVWQDDIRGVYGLRLRPQGTPVGEAFPLFADTGLRREPVVVSAPDLNQYLVVYTYGATGSREVHGIIVDAEGHPIYGGLIIAAGAGDRDQLDADYDPSDDRFIVAWHSTENDQGDIYARLLESDGSMPSTRFQVAKATDAQSAPAVAWNRDANMYLVVWHDYRNSGITGADIYGQRFEPSGNPEGGNFRITASSDLHDEQYPDVVYVNVLDRYRVVWQDNRDFATLGWDLRGRWVAPDGSVLGVLDDPVFRYGGYQEHPALAYAHADEQLFAVWQDGRNAIEYDIYGRLVLDTTPPTAAFTRDPSFGRAGDLFTFNAWPSRDNMTPKGALLVRWDFNNDGVWDTPLGFEKYITVTLNASGVHTVTLEVQDLALYTDTVAYRVAVLPATAAAVPQAEPPAASLTVTPTFGVAGSTFSADGSASTGSGSLIARWDWENDGEFDTGFGADLEATHVYTVASDYSVRLEVRDQTTGLSDAVLYNITVLPDDPVALELLPAEVRLVPTEVLRFRAFGWDQYSNQMAGPDVAWSVANPQVGSISATGVLTAGYQSGSYPDVIHAEGDGVLDTASVIVFWPYQAYVPVILKAY
jgi:hypothetical protein